MELVNGLKSHTRFYFVTKRIQSIIGLIKKFFTDFRSGKAPILVATDVAARGLGKFFVYP